MSKGPRRVVTSLAESRSPARVAISRVVRARSAAHVYDGSGDAPLGTAIYTLSDPRSIRVPRYVGQTREPRRRYLQHVRAAALWIPDDLPWWVGQERYRPLYEWLRDLYRDEQRLPMMIVSAWHDVAADATAAERALIQESLRAGFALLNLESAELEPQIRLL